MPDADFVVRLLRATQFDNCDDLWWRTAGETGPDGPLQFFVRCSDTFAYACADLEEVTPENVAALEQAYADCRAVDRNADMWGGALFVARVRRQVPIAPFLRLVEQPAVVALFTACAAVPS